MTRPLASSPGGCANARATRCDTLPAPMLVWPASAAPPLVRPASSRSSSSTSPAHPGPDTGRHGTAAPEGAFPAKPAWFPRRAVMSNGDGKAPRPFPRWTRERHGGPGRSGQGTHTRAGGADLPGLRRRLSARSDPQRAARHPQPPAPWRHSCRSPGRRKFGGEPPAKSRKQKHRLRPGPGFAQKSVLLVNSRTQERSQTWSTDCRAWV